MHKIFLRKQLLLLLISIYILTSGTLCTAFVGIDQLRHVYAVSPRMHASPPETNNILHSLPNGCGKYGKTDYPGAINCILDPAKHDCDLVPGPGTNTPCNYFSSSHYSPTYRQGDTVISHIVIHDSEGTALSAIRTFEDPNYNSATHYIVDRDGTIYQTVREKDIAFHAGNRWYNQHSIGIEHAGYDALGFQWYTTAEYLASAHLVAYLLDKYHIPLDHNHIVSHGTVPSLTLADMPNHVDPGPYWLWDYYLNLIRTLQKSPKETISTSPAQPHIITLHPPTALKPFGHNGKETHANFNFFYLYNGPSTKSGLIQREYARSNIIHKGKTTHFLNFDVINNVESSMSYYYINKVRDPAGTRNTLYEIWYGITGSISSPFAHAKLAWLAVPPATAFQGTGMALRLKSADGSPIQISSKPGTNTTSANYYIGDAPNGTIFASDYSMLEDGKDTLWYEINYNHRQAWVPARMVSVQDTP